MYFDGQGTQILPYGKIPQEEGGGGGEGGQAGGGGGGGAGCVKAGSWSQKLESGGDEEMVDMTNRKP